MKTWYNSLSSRDKGMVVFISIAVLGLLFWLLLAKPLYNKHQKLNKVISSQKNTLEVMKKQSVQVKRLQALDKKESNTVAGNPQQLIERALQTWRLKPQLERMQSQGANGVRLVLKNANADRFMRFLYELEDKYGLSISSLTINNAKKEAGFADVRLTVTKEAP